MRGGRDQPLAISHQGSAIGDQGEEQRGIGDEVLGNGGGGFVVRLIGAMGSLVVGGVG